VTLPAGAGPEIVMFGAAFPKTSWFVAFVRVIIGKLSLGNIGAVVKVLVPLIVWFPSVITNCELAPVSGIVYVRFVDTAFKVVVVPDPKTSWLLATAIVSANALGVKTNVAAPPSSGIEYVRDTAGGGALIVMVCAGAKLKINWLAGFVSVMNGNDSLGKMGAVVNVFVPLIV